MNRKHKKLRPKVNMLVIFLLSLCSSYVFIGSGSVEAQTQNIHRLRPVRDSRTGKERYTETGRQTTSSETGTQTWRQME